MTIRGMELSRLDMMESRICTDIKRESKRYHGNILLHEEIVEGEVQPVYEAVYSYLNTSGFFCIIIIIRLDRL